jgi:hemerythrin HHE cation binding domain-containing protein
MTTGSGPRAEQQEELEPLTSTEDLFTPIHKAIRSMIYELGARLQRTDFADPVASAAVLSDLEHEFSNAISSACVLCLLHGHGADEESVPFPAMLPFDEAMIRTLITEHQEFSRMLSSITTLARGLPSLTSLDERLERGRRINQDVNGFFASYLVHLNKEERTLVPAMREHFTDEQIRAMRSTIMRGMPKERFAAILRWMLPSLTLSELSGMLMGIKQGAPPEMLQFVAGVGAANVEPARWALVRERVGL